MQTRPIFIIDCFARTQVLEKKLHDCVQNLKSRGADIMVISNTPISKETMNLTNYFLYDSENLLFNESLRADDIKLFHRLNDLVVYEVVTGVQRHGLSVLRNLFKALKTASEYGYTHFHRVEVDDIMGERSLDTMMNMPQNIDAEGKKGMFFLNDNEKESNISFHYMYCEIDHFLRNVRQINSQEDYTNYLRNEMGTEFFKNVEEFVRHNINREIGLLKTHNGKDMSTYFPDTTWNTEISQSNLDNRFRGCTTRIYRVIKDKRELLDQWLVITYNYVESSKNRRIELLSSGRVVGELTHQAESTYCWSWNSVAREVDAIRVFENGQELYVESVWEMHPEQLVEVH